MKKITAVVRSAEEITGVKGCISFQCEDIAYTDRMNALANLRFQFIQGKYFRYKCKTLEGDVYSFQPEWLRDIREEVMWEEVPVDDLVKDRDTGLLYHFASYNSYTRRVFVFRGGKSSKTSANDNCPVEIIDNPELVEEE